VQTLLYKTDVLIINASAVRMQAIQIAEITCGSLKGEPANQVSEIFTDSRAAAISDTQMFIAIRGKNHDGHRFISALYSRGVKVFLTEVLPQEADNMPGASFIVTANSVTALQKLAAWKRSLFNGKVIAVTGSAGKTIVKEWLADVMGLAFPVIRSPKSYNSQIGVPLSVWNLVNDYSAGIIEAGISQEGEMENLARVILPGTGIITNIGEAHSKGFNSEEHKCREKLRLFTNCSTVVYCLDFKLIDTLIRADKRLSHLKLANWSFTDESAFCLFSKADAGNGRTLLKVKTSALRFETVLPFADRASVENAATVITTCLAEGLDEALIIKGITQLQPVAMRMEIKKGINDTVLIEDYYNSDPGSLGMALEYLKSSAGGKTTLILSDFLESSRKGDDLYMHVASLVSKFGISRLIGIGPEISKHREAFNGNSHFCISTDEFIRNFVPSQFSNETILLKGARQFEFERISALLEQKMHQTVLEVNLDDVAHNLSEFRRILSPGVRIMAMVKAFAYGSGSVEIASFLEYNRVDYLAVAYADEGAELRRAGIQLPVMVMNPEASAFTSIIQNSLEPEIFNMRTLSEFGMAAERHGLVGYPVHIKVDTGMHRLGFMPEEKDELIKYLKSNDSMKVVSVFTHLAASEDKALDEFTRRQMKTFTVFANDLSERLGCNIIKHALNSAGIARFPEYHFDMVRPGIGIYGAAKVPGLSLKPAARFYTHISQIKKINAGEPVGYGCLGASENERLIGIIPVGYADGLDRRLGNGAGSLFVKNTKAPLIGNVCMDMCMIDVTGTGAQEGDVAEIFGSCIDVGEVAERSGTIPYEIITSVSPRVKRIFTRE
jgi:alanine racemase